MNAQQHAMELHQCLPLERMILEQLAVMRMAVHAYARLEPRIMVLVTRLIIKAIICIDLLHLVSIIVILPTDNVDFKMIYCKMSLISMCPCINIQTNAPDHFKKMEKDQNQTQNALVPVYTMLVGGVRAIATPTKTNHSGEQNALNVQVQDRLTRNKLKFL